MEIRMANVEDIPSVDWIIHQAKEYFKQSGIPQWQEGSPNVIMLKEDIERRELYVALEQDKIIAVIALCSGIEQNYLQIEGAWLNDEAYIAIHRVAVHPEYKGKNVAGALFAFAIAFAKKQNVHNLRIDTHRVNHPMQRLIQKNGFTYCGRIDIGGANGERFAFQKEI